MVAGAERFPASSTAYTSIVFTIRPALTLQRLSRLLQERHQLLTTPGSEV